MATEVNPVAGLPHLSLGMGRDGLNVCMERSSGRERERDKLIILNVHGTLVDYSLEQEKNPNSRVRPTVRTRSRRVFFRPWLVPFLSKCFLNFSVAFWGSKSKSYMDDIIPAMMKTLKPGLHFSPLFVWAGKDCEATEYEGTTPIAWGKSLRKFYNLWPRFNASNTLLIENKLSQVACNPPANVVISKPFYVAQMTKLVDDNNYLKDTLWPMLEALFDSTDMSHFRSRFCGNVDSRATEVHHICDDRTSVDDSVLVEGEGTCEPQGFNAIMAPHLHIPFCTDVHYACVQKNVARKETRVKTILLEDKGREAASKEVNSHSQNICSWSLDGTP